MSAADAIALARRSGFKLAVDGDRLEYEVPAPASPRSSNCCASTRPRPSICCSPNAAPSSPGSAITSGPRLLACAPIAARARTRPTSLWRSSSVRTRPTFTHPVIRNGSPIGKSRPASHSVLKRQSKETSPNERRRETGSSGRRMAPHGTDHGPQRNAHSGLHRISDPRCKPYATTPQTTIPTALRFSGGSRQSNRQSEAMSGRGGKRTTRSRLAARAIQAGGQSSRQQSPKRSPT